MYVFSDCKNDLVERPTSKVKIILNVYEDLVVATILCLSNPEIIHKRTYSLTFKYYQGS